MRKFCFCKIVIPNGDDEKKINLFFFIRVLVVNLPTYNRCSFNKRKCQITNYNDKCIFLMFLELVFFSSKFIVCHLID